MEATHQDARYLTIDLGERDSARLVEQALRQKADVTLNPRTGAGTMRWSGSLSERRDESLFVKMDEGVTPVLPSTYCEAAFSVHGAEYLFATNVLDVLEGEGGTCVEIACPRCLQTWQRRRFVRAAIAPSARVYLGGPGTQGLAGAEGVLLNVSRQGLACKVERSVADRYTLEEAVDVVFSLRPFDTEFALPARLRGKTAAASSEQTILRLEFHPTDQGDEQIQRLSEALETY